MMMQEEFDEKADVYRFLNQFFSLSILISIDVLLTCIGITLQFWNRIMGDLNRKGSIPSPF